jgi:hypothetical protein
MPSFKGFAGYGANVVLIIIFRINKLAIANNSTFHFCHL